MNRRRPDIARRDRWLIAIAMLLSAATPTAARAQPASRWAAVAAPAAGPARIVGGTSLGCLAGAVPLPADGPGWQAVRLARNRHWGHPALIGLVATLGEQAAEAALPPLLIGDLAQPRGGPLPYGHASHQTGLDVDIWLDVTPRRRLGTAAREHPDVPSLVAGEAIDAARWRPGHATLIRLAASQPGVDRVLVNPVIKRQLCREQPGAAWLRRVRPWWGHDSHMHVRLRCPRGQPDCHDITPPPLGDGCDATLDWWSTDAARTPTPRPPGPAPTLPIACSGILTAP